MAHQPHGRRPWRNVDHVDTDDDVRLDRWAELSCDIELNGGCDVDKTEVECPGVDACARVPIGIAWLKRQFWMSGGEMHRVLTAPTRDLEHSPKFGQLRAQCLQDRVAIASGRRSIAASIDNHEIDLSSVVLDGQVRRDHGPDRPELASKIIAHRQLRAIPQAAIGLTASGNSALHRDVR